jgi:nucleoside-diphosphate-sugar epimerase
MRAQSGYILITDGAGFIGTNLAGDQKWYVANTSKIRDALGWSPTTSIKEGLRALYEWYLERPCLVHHSKEMVA